MSFFLHQTEAFMGWDLEFSLDLSTRQLTVSSTNSLTLEQWQQLQAAFSAAAQRLEEEPTPSPRWNGKEWILRVTTCISPSFPCRCASPPQYYFSSFPC